MAAPLQTPWLPDCSVFLRRVQSYEAEQQARNVDCNDAVSSRALLIAQYPGSYMVRWGTRHGASTTLKSQPRWLGIKSPVCKFGANRIWLRRRSRLRRLRAVSFGAAWPGEARKSGGSARRIALLEAPVTCKTAASGVEAEWDCGLDHDADGCCSCCYVQPRVITSTAMQCGLALRL